MKIEEIEINKIRPDKNQPRRTFNPFAIQEMAQSIVTEGVINPIEVDKDLVIVTGEMRWRSAKKAGLKTVPCKIISISPDIRFRRQVVENVHHNTMSEIDTARALEKLLTTLRTVRDEKETSRDKGFTGLGRIIGKERDWIRRHMDFLAASKKFQAAVDKKGVALSHIDVINSVPPEYKSRVEEKVIAGGFGTRDGARMVAQAIKKYPDQIEPLLKSDYTNLDTAGVMGRIHKLIPGYSETPISDSITKAFEPAEEINNSIRKLISLLSKYTPEEVGAYHYPRILLNLRDLARKAQPWMDEPKKLN